MKRILLIITSIIIAVSSFSQQEDAEFWTGISLEKKINKKFTLGLSEEFRFNENVSRIEQFFTNVGLTYKISKNISWGVSYRFVQKQELDNTYNSSNKIYTDLRLKKSISRFSFSLRNRYQFKYVNLFSEGETNTDNYLRNKLSIKYNVKKSPFTPFIGAETYLKLNKDEYKEIDRYRLTMGTSYKINKESKLSMFYRIEQDINVSEPIKANIFGLRYSYEF